MIGKQDILERAAEWNLRPEVVEKDYVLGWLLAAFASDPTTMTTWVFKGGTCLKKCFFETYRFSEDLDFSLTRGAAYTPDALLEVVKGLARLASELSGINFAEDKVQMVPRQDLLARPTFEGRLGYQGPLVMPTWPRLRLDITAHEPLLAPASRRAVFHPYPDRLPAEMLVSTYSMEELFAEKTRALWERTRPRDFYDVTYLLTNRAGEIDLRAARKLFRGKCWGASSRPSLGSTSPLSLWSDLRSRRIRSDEARPSSRREAGSSGTKGCPWKRFASPAPIG
jgi:predicted nucleotidyltransferase component of viral defense system